MLLKVGKFYKINKNICMLCQAERSPTKRSCLYSMADLRSGKFVGGTIRTSEKLEVRDLTTLNFSQSWESLQMENCSEIEIEMREPETKKDAGIGNVMVVADNKTYLWLKYGWDSTLININTGRALEDKTRSYHIRDIERMGRIKRYAVIIPDMKPERPEEGNATDQLSQFLDRVGEGTTSSTSRSTIQATARTVWPE